MSEIFNLNLVNTVSFQVQSTFLEILMSVSFQFKLKFKLRKKIDGLAELFLHSDFDAMYFGKTQPQQSN